MLTYAQVFRDARDKGDATSKKMYKQLGTHFTCFTGTKVKILTQKRCAGSRPPRALRVFATHFTCFTGTKVQTLTQKRCAASRPPRALCVALQDHAGMRS